MGSITTAFCTSAKLEFFYGAHDFGGIVTPTGTVSNASPTVTSVSNMSGIAVGMFPTDTGNSSIQTGTIVASIDSATQFTMSKNATGSHASTALSIAADTFKIALIIATPTGTYGSTSVNYTDITGNGDEVSGAGYTATGLALTNISPVIGGTVAYINFSPNPSWTSASFSTLGCMIYNTIASLGGTSGTNTQGAGRAIGVFSFGGTQTVTSGTLTILMPAATNTTAIFRLG